jgi:hypothetical protein
MIQHATSSLAKIKTLPNTFGVVLYGWVFVYTDVVYSINLTELNETKRSSELNQMKDIL